MAPAQLALDGGTPVRTEPLELGKGISLFGDEERKAVLEVLESRSLFRYYGPDLRNKVAAFESTAAALLGVRHAVAVSSGTAAIRVALEALGVGCGDEVIIPSFTFIATVNAVVVSGAVPVFAEVDDTLGLDPADVEAKLSERTAAIVAVHLENEACDIDAIVDIGRRHDVALIEDTAQSMGATLHGRALGSIGDFGTFSLQLEKNATSGEGGLVTTNDDDLYLRAARYQDQGGQFITSHGVSRGDELADSFVGENLRMAELAGAVAEVQTRRIPELLERMRANKRYVLAAVGSIDSLMLRRSLDPAGDGGSSVTWFLPTKDLAKRFAAALRAEGVPAAQFYRGRPVYEAASILEKRTASGKGGPWHCGEHPCEIEYRMGMCPKTEELVARNVIVPLGVGYSERDCDDVAEAVRKVAATLL